MSRRLFVFISSAAATGAMAFPAIAANIYIG